MLIDTTAAEESLSPKDPIIRSHTRKAIKIEVSVENKRFFVG